MTEQDCLQYCYQHGIYWLQNGIRLYDILDRVSCVHCQNKNKKELRNIRHYLPDKWDEFKTWQANIPYGYVTKKIGIFELEHRFSQEDKQMTIFSLLQETKNKD